MQTVIVPSVVRFRITEEGKLVKTYEETVEISVERLAKEIKALLDREV